MDPDTSPTQTNQRKRAKRIDSTPGPSHQPLGTDLVNPAELMKYGADPESPLGSDLGDVDMGVSLEGIRSLPSDVVHNVISDLGMGECKSPSCMFGCGLADYEDVEMLLPTEARTGNIHTPDRTMKPPPVPNKKLEPEMTRNHDPHSLPSFIKPIPKRMDKDDIEYLQAKGVLEIPNPPFLSALLRCFAEYVYPYMPVVNIHELLEVVAQSNGANQSQGISLLLFQAVISASIGFLDDRLLKLAGFQSRKEARRVYFHRTRILYDFDYETDRIVLIQALVLMTQWHEDLDDEKGPSHWMGLAVSLAYRSGLHDSRGPSRSAEQSLRRRIWWSLYMRDCFISLGFRRPLWIAAGDYDVAMLQKSDFGIRALSGDARDVYSQSSRMLQSEATQADLAEMSVAMARLSVCVRHVLQTQYSVQTSRPSVMRGTGTTHSVTMLHPIPDGDGAGIDAIERELQGWLASLPLCCHAPSPDAGGSMAVVEVHRILLLVFYYTAIMALHRPQTQTQLPVARLTTTATVSALRRELAQSKVLNAARHVAEMASDLHRLRLTRFLPASSVTGLLATTMVHLIDMRNPAPPARELATKNFFLCMQALNELREIYNAADKAAQIIQAALNGVVIDINSSQSISAAPKI